MHASLWIARSPRNGGPAGEERDSWRNYRLPTSPETTSLVNSGSLDPAKSAAKRASCDGAERALFRYSKWPTQAITYRLGKDQIFALRAEAEKRLGDKFSLKAFHLAFISQGTIPSGYFHDALLAELQKTR